MAFKVEQFQIGLHHKLTFFKEKRLAITALVGNQSRRTKNSEFKPAWRGLGFIRLSFPR